MAYLGKKHKPFMKKDTDDENFDLFRASTDTLAKYDVVESSQNNQECYESLIFIESLLNDEDVDESFKKNSLSSYFVSDSFLTERLADRLVWLIEKRDDFNLNDTKEMNSYYEPYEQTTENERRIFNFALLLSIFDNLLRMEKSVRSLLNTDKYLLAYLELFQDLKFCTLLEAKLGKYFSLLINNLKWISKEANVNEESLNIREMWTKLNGMDIIIDFMKYFKKYQVILIFIVANIANDKQIMNMENNGISGSIDALATIISETVNDNLREDADDDNIPRIEIADFDADFKNEVNDSTEGRVHVIYYYDAVLDVRITINNLLHALNTLSLTFKTKKKIFDNLLIKSSLEKIILFGNTIEKTMALKVMASLCFDASVGKEVSDNSRLMREINKLTASTDPEAEKVGIICEKVLFWINEGKKEKTNRKSVDVSEISKSEDGIKHFR
jgi:hypothetical protein